MAVRRGFSLIELVIFMAITTLTMVILMRSLMTILAVRERTKIAADVQQTSRMAMERIGLAIMNATSLTAADTDILSLGGSANIGGEAATSAIQFYRCGNAICVQEGANPAVTLTPSSVNVTSLVFSNLSNGSPGIVKVSIAATDTNNMTSVHPVLTITSSFALRQ
jgi:type II secretory pathway pseudopilin PulG